jgi:hypothetical protein
MLHWICPDCGNDCPPTVRECPACADVPSKSIPPSEEAVTEGVLALARRVQPSSEIPLLEHAPQQLLLAAVNGSATTNGHSNGTKSMVALKKEYVAIPEDESINSLVRSLVESAEAAPDVEPLIEDCVEAVAIAVEIAVETAEAQPVIESVATSVEEPPPIADGAPVEVAVEETPAVETPEAATVVELPVETLPEYDPVPLCQALELHAEALLKVISVQLGAFDAGIRAIMAGFEAPPINALLDVPREIVKAPAPPATQRMRTPKPSITFVRPDDPNSSALSAGPITSALAGPCLPLDLRTLSEKKSTTSGRTKSRGKMPAWPISVLVATGLFLGAGSLMQYLASRDAAVSSASQRPVQGNAATSVAAAVDPHPFARFVEVTGLRVSADLNRKSQLQYLVVNHSSARLSDVVLKIAVRSTADSSGSPPLFSLSVVVPSLAPYQSKEIKTDLDAGLRSTAIPDWENLRADVQVSTKQ